MRVLTVFWDKRKLSGGWFDECQISTHSSLSEGEFMNFRKVRAAAVLATMTSSLLAPAAAWAASAPAQPGTVRPEEKVVAQPGTSRAAESNEADDNKPAGKQP